METKMRITLYDENNSPISDRLIEQAVEFRTGPKAVHKGRLRLELNLNSKEDAELSVEYIQKLIGNLPLKTMKLVRITKGTVIEDDKEPQEEFMKSALKKATQEELIDFLREHGFKFIESDVIFELVKDLKDNIQLKEIHHKYQFMIRLVKEAKNPLNDKYDHRLLFGIKIVGKRIDKVVVYLFGKFKKKAIIPWKDRKKVNFKKVEKMMVFPAHMDYDDRKKWRIEHRRIENIKAQGGTPTPSKFYSKNAPFVKLL